MAFRDALPVNAVHKLRSYAETASPGQQDPCHTAIPSR